MSSCRSLLRPLPWCPIFNSSAPGRSECDSKNVIFNLVLLIDIFRSSHHNALRRMPQDLTGDKSTLIQVMAWCRQATSHYLSQCWLSSLSPYGVARPQWVKLSQRNAFEIGHPSNLLVCRDLAAENWFAETWLHNRVAPGSPSRTRYQLDQFIAIYYEMVWNFRNVYIYIYIYIKHDEPVKMCSV